MTRRPLVAAGLATVFVLGAACGGVNADDPTAGATADAATTTTESASPSPAAETGPPFDVAAWKLQWDGAKQDLVDSMGSFSNQVRFLIDKGASDAQLASAFPRLATDVANAAGAFVVALDAAGPVPADRSDVASAAAVLRDAIVVQQQAYGAVAACGENTACQQGAFGAVSASPGAVGAAIRDLPDK